MTTAQDRDQIDRIRSASRLLVRELGFMRPTLADTEFSASSVHALIEIGGGRANTATMLCDRLLLEKSSISRLLKRLQAEGLVAGVRDAEDGRSKRLRLTPSGARVLERIHAFARDQVAGATQPLPADMVDGIERSLRAYAYALKAARTGDTRPRESPACRIEAGYRPGLIGRLVAMQTEYYAGTVSFGRAFEAKVATEMAAFMERADRPMNRTWAALSGTDDEIVGGISIDGEDLDGEDGDGSVAHLRWFITGDAVRGKGVGRDLLGTAMAFVDDRGFAETRLWTFDGLAAARRLYEQVGFVLVEEQAGAQWGREVLEQQFVRRRPAATR